MKKNFDKKTMKQVYMMYLSGRYYAKEICDKFCIYNHELHYIINQMEKENEQV